jgi:hypothetical protein
MAVLILACLANPVDYRLCIGVRIPPGVVRANPFYRGTFATKTAALRMWRSPMLFSRED